MKDDIGIHPIVIWVNYNALTSESDDSLFSDMRRRNQPLTSRLASTCKTEPTAACETTKIKHKPQKDENERMKKKCLFSRYSRYRKTNLGKDPKQTPYPNQSCSVRLFCKCSTLRGERYRIIKVFTPYCFIIAPPPPSFWCGRRGGVAVALQLHRLDPRKVKTPTQSPDPRPMQMQMQPDTETTQRLTTRFVVCSQITGSNASSRSPLRIWEACNSFLLTSVFGHQEAKVWGPVSTDYRDGSRQSWLLAFGFSYPANGAYKRR
jgi:hypothetical protein